MRKLAKDKKLNVGQKKQDVSKKKQDVGKKKQEEEPIQRLQMVRCRYQTMKCRFQLTKMFTVAKQLASCSMTDNMLLSYSSKIAKATSKVMVKDLKSTSKSILDLFGSNPTASSPQMTKPNVILRSGTSSLRITRVKTY